ncbi:hypothetical protein [Streptomyces sp. E11-3]|uniref:hypothetical protein n=1 Tax=Streptomyces sp. E11-3 TaxID=3110112 RepID=UPI0039815F5B
MAQYYDSVRQRNMLLGSSNDVARLVRPHVDVSVIGQLRWDAIRSPRRLQTHAQLLDGCLFHLIANDRYVDRISGVLSGRTRTLPFEVTVSGGSLEDSLRDMLSRPFLFSSLAATRPQRIALQEALEASATLDEVDRRCARDGVVEGLFGLIKDTGIVPVTECERLRDSWRYWVDAERHGTLVTRPAQPYGDDTQSFAMEGFADLALLTPAGRFVASRIVSPATLDVRTGTRRRSLVWREIERLNQADTAERSDALQLKLAFDRCYYRTIAQAEHAMFSSEDSTALRGVRRKASLRLRDPARTVIFPHNFQEQLGRMTAEQWAGFLEDFSEELHNWWESWDVESLQEIGNRLRSPAVSPRPSTSMYVNAVISVGSGTASTLADPSTQGMMIGGGVSLATWVIAGPVAQRMQQWSSDRHARYDVVEVRHAETD